MKTKKFFLPSIFIAVTIIVYIVATIIFCYTTKPAVTKGEFPFSITYEYKGETKTLAGVFDCKFSNSYTTLGEHDRHWIGEARYVNPENTEDPHIVDENIEMQTTLSVHENMDAGYFMGDPLYKDYYQELGHEGPEPFVQHYDYQNNIELDGENKDEVLESIGFKIIDFTYAEPIENSFSFSGIAYKADNIIIFVAISLLCLLACLIFVRKDKEYKYSVLDKIGIVLNLLVAILAVPFIYSVCTLFGILGGAELLDQIIYNLPPITILCLALSIVFRRKGFSRTGFFIQFGGVLPFMVIFVIGNII
ncbi:MAG: hypothetical protein IKU84_03235 [Clostridia bacterium]|nr:hypothetical protein [Clostridia bacterium]